MPIRVTFASTDPLSDALVGLADPERIVKTETTFGHAVHAFTEHDDPERLRAELAAAADGVAVAVIDGALATEDARLILCDVDSTLTTTEAVDLLAEYAGAGDEVAAITEAAMRGEIDFEQSLRRRVATLKGLPTSVFEEVYPRMTLSPGAHELIAAAKERGAKVGVTSGGFTHLVGPLAEELGLDFMHANQLEIVSHGGGEFLTGNVIGKVVDKLQKSLDLRAFAFRQGVPMTHTVAVGDGANDLKMLATAALGVAYCAKPVAALQADVAIPFKRLDAVAAFAFPQA